MGEKRGSDQLSPLEDDIHKRYSFNPDLLAQNRFHVLANEDNSDDINDNSLENKSQKGPKVPPIFLHNKSNHKEIINDIKALTTEKFTTIVKNNSLKINLTSINDYRTLTKYYTEKKLEFHTFQDLTKRTLAVVLRNVPISLTDIEIKDELTTYSLPIISVTRLLNKVKLPMPLCAVELAPNEKAKDIFNIKEICNALITVEPRKKSQIIPHDPPKCANCGEEHPANYRGCRAHTELQQLHPRQMRRTTTNSIHRSTFRTSDPNVSFANIIQKNLPSQNTSTPNPPPKTSNNPEMSTIVTSIMNLLKQIITPLISQIKNYLLNELFLSFPHA
ncbi:uncharacterized protein [Onthophagus taurus]|uniref:uncharacterized protein n=1 Tax=Onthophagus taurus TaxID=166361 RepID=UPI0039BDE321